MAGRGEGVAGARTVAGGGGSEVTALELDVAGGDDRSAVECRWGGLERRDGGGSFGDWIIAVEGVIHGRQPCFAA